MNLYLRYFDRETLVQSVDEAIDFLNSIGEFDMDPELEADIRAYAASDVYFPKRYKIRPRVYFIIIKTEAATMQDFKEKRNVRKADAPLKEKGASPVLMKLNEEREGWYEGVLDFKRVQMVPGTGKFQYRDTRFVAQVKAYSGLDCYNRIIDHLKYKLYGTQPVPLCQGQEFPFPLSWKGKAR